MGPSLADDASSGSGKYHVEPDSGFSSETAAPPRAILTSRQARIAILRNTMCMWSIGAKPLSCCHYHAAVSDLLKIGANMRRGPCDAQFGPIVGCQCSHCGAIIPSGIVHCVACIAMGQRETGQLSRQRRSL